MTFDPSTEMVTVYNDGEATPTQITDPVADRLAEVVRAEVQRLKCTVFWGRRALTAF